jgi:hypothetical protein
LAGRGYQQPNIFVELGSRSTDCSRQTRWSRCQNPKIITLECASDCLLSLNKIMCGYGTALATDISDRVSQTEPDKYDEHTIQRSGRFGAGKRAQHFCYAVTIMSTSNKHFDIFRAMMVDDECEDEVFWHMRWRFPQNVFYL